MGQFELYFFGAQPPSELTQRPGGHEISNSPALLACVFFWLSVFAFASGLIRVCCQIR